MKSRAINAAVHAGVRSGALDWPVRRSLDLFVADP
jgi:hypothetical protein